MPDVILSAEPAFLLVVKFGTILFLVVYVIFAAVIIKQVRMMTETLDLGFETQIKLVVLLHFIFSVAVLFLALVIL